MRSEYSVDDIKFLAMVLEQEIRKRGYIVDFYINSVVGKYGCVFNFANGKIYTTGFDSKDVCVSKLKKKIEDVDELVVKYCATNNL